MNAIDALEESFDDAIAQFNQSAAIQRLLAGDLTIAHYKSILREVFHYSKEDPQIQALAAVYFRGADRGFVKPFLKHAMMEIGHDRMALADLNALGEDTTNVLASNPLPSTVALISFPFYQINYLGAIGYLGYLYFLEHMPTRQGQAYGLALARLGVPPEAMTFLHEHMTVDVGHNRLMEQYLDGLVRTKDDLESVVYAMQTTGYLYGSMLDGAVRQAESPRDFGCSEREARGLVRTSDLAPDNARVPAFME